MQETTACEIELGDMEGPVLQALVSYMYGRPVQVADEQLLALFLAADAHQVRLMSTLYCRADLHVASCFGSHTGMLQQLVLQLLACSTLYHLCWGER